jgi:hypothetical protein
MQVEETTPSTPLPPTRAGFVRGLPLSMPVEEVIERGREAGIKLQPSDIHAARYYMRKAEEPQQLLLGGPFVHKRGPRGANGAAGAISSASSGSHGAASAAIANGASNGAAGKAAASSAQSVELVAASQAEDFDSEFSEEEEAQTKIAPALKGRGRKAALQEAKHAKQASIEFKQETKAQAKANAKSNSKVKTKAELKAEHKANGANGLHSRLQARLRNVTFRDTAREERDAARAEKATIGKALSELDNAVKPRGKRAAQTAEAVEQELRQIALRVGTQRVRELLDAMEELAARRA